MSINQVFVYGTLKRQFFVTALLEREVTMKTYGPRVSGYAIYPVKHAHFPGVVPKTDFSIMGALILDITEDDLKALDLYEAEGTLYNRIEVETEKHGRAYMYVIKDPSILDKSDGPLEYWYLEK